MGNRRGRGEGSVSRRKDGRWQVRVPSAVTLKESVNRSTPMPRRKLKRSIGCEGSEAARLTGSCSPRARRPSRLISRLVRDEQRGVATEHAARLSTRDRLVPRAGVRAAAGRAADAADDSALADRSTRRNTAPAGGSSSRMHVCARPCPRRSACRSSRSMRPNS